MDDVFSQRLTELIKNGNYTLDQIAEAAGKRAATISRYASGEIKGVKRSTIIAIADLYGVSPSWLAGLSDEKYSNTKQIRIPILRIKNIDDIFSDVNVVDYMDMKFRKDIPDIENYFAIEPTEDNMLPLLGLGDLAIVHYQSNVQNGQTALVYIPERNIITIKKIIKNDNVFELYSMNPYFPVEKSKDIKILGRVVKSQSENAFN